MILVRGARVTIGTWIGSRHRIDMSRAHTDEDIQWSLHGVRAHQADWVLDFGVCFGFSSALFRDHGVLEFSGLHVEVPQNALLTFSLRDDTPIFIVLYFFTAMRVSREQMGGWPVCAMRVGCDY